MAKEVFHRPDPETDCPDEAINGRELLPAFQDPENVKGRRQERQARATVVTMNYIRIDTTDEDGLPGFPAEMKQEFRLTYRDPEGKGRTIGQQLDALLSGCEKQTLRDLEASSG